MKDTVPYFQWGLWCSWSPFVIGGHAAGRTQDMELVRMLLPGFFRVWPPINQENTTLPHGSALAVPKLLCAGICCPGVTQSVTSHLGVTLQPPKHGDSTRGDTGDQG